MAHTAFVLLVFIVSALQGCSGEDVDITIPEVNSNDTIPDDKGTTSLPMAEPTTVSVSDDASPLTINSFPSELVPGLTSLRVTCSVPPLTSQDSILISLILMKWNEDNQVYEELAVAELLKNEIVRKIKNIPAQVTGDIERDTAAFLRLTWDAPTTDNAGTYLCEANIMGPNGHAQNHTSSLEVTVKKVDIDELAKEFSKLKTKAREFEEEVAALKKQLDSQQDCCSKRDEFAINSFSLFFDPNVTVDSLRYYLSRFEYRGFEDAQSACRSIGGILMEHDTAKLHEITPILVERKIPDIYYWIGVVKDENKHHNFVSTGVRFAGIEFESENQNHNCLVWHTQHNGKHTSTDCVTGSFPSICTVPVASP